MSGSDQFVRGMSAWSEDDDAVLDRYRLWQLDAAFRRKATVAIR
jgi:hypothetical protein